MTGGDSGDDLFAAVGCGSGRKVGTELEGDLGFKAAVAPLKAGEVGSVWGDPGERHGGKGGGGFGVGGADLVAPDGAIIGGERVLDEVNLHHVGGADAGWKVDDGCAGAAGVEEEVGGFEKLGLAEGGDCGHAELLSAVVCCTSRCLVLRCQFR